MALESKMLNRLTFTTLVIVLAVSCVLLFLTRRLQLFMMGGHAAGIRNEQRLSCGESQSNTAKGDDSGLIVEPEWKSIDSDCAIDVVITCSDNKTTTKTAEPKKGKVTLTCNSGAKLTKIEFTCKESDPAGKECRFSYERTK
jgi:hypothetical protein